MLAIVTSEGRNPDDPDITELVYDMDSIIDCSQASVTVFRRAMSTDFVTMETSQTEAPSSCMRKGCVQRIIRL